MPTGDPTSVERRFDGWPTGDGQDDARQGRGHRVRHDLLQRLLLHAHLQVPRRVGEARPAPLRDGTVFSLSPKLPGREWLSRFFPSFGVDWGPN